MGSNMREVKCPLCREKIKMATRAWIGQEVICPACEAILEVVGLSPLSLDWPYDDSGYIGLDFEEEVGH